MKTLISTILLLVLNCTICYCDIAEAIFYFLNSAQKSGDITVIVRMGNGTVCTAIVPIVAGATMADKADAVSNALNIVCPGQPVTATALPPGLVKVVPSNGWYLKKIEVEDNTNQRINLNHSPVASSKIQFSGTGSCPTGTAYFSLNDCGSAATTPTFGKNGFQVLTDLLAGITNCYSGGGTTIVAADLGGGTGEIQINNLPAGANVTFDCGGDCGITEKFSIENNTNSIPTLPVWGLIILSVFLMSSGIFLVRRMV